MESEEDVVIMLVATAAVTAAGRLHHCLLLLMKRRGFVVPVCLCVVSDRSSTSEWMDGIWQAKVQKEQLLILSCDQIG